MALPGTIRVLLCDDHVVVREGLARLLENAEGIEVVAVASDGAEGLEQARASRPDVVLMDLSMPRLDGVAATRAILAELPDTYIVVLTSFADRERVLEAIDAGRRGLRAEGLRRGGGGARDSLRRDRRRAARPARRPGRADAGTRRPPSSTSLTPREREVLALVGAGLSNKIIALRLGISEATVKAHLTRIYQQIGVTDRTQAALWAREHDAV